MLSADPDRARVDVKGTVVRLLDLDPDLGSGIAQHDWSVARHAIRAHLISVARGECDLTSVVDGGEVLGLVVNQGMLSREVALDGHVALELLGPGDVLLPDVTQFGGGWGGPVTICALSPARLIVLGTPFIRAAASLPALLINLRRRLEASRQRLALQGLIAHLARAEDRVLLTLRLLADGCGRVTREGTIVPLSLSHDTLARLAAARRPTVTLALGALRAADYVRPCSGGGLILTWAADRRVAELTGPGKQLPPLGTRIAIHDDPTPAVPGPLTLGEGYPAEETALSLSRPCA